MKTASNRYTTLTFALILVAMTAAVSVAYAKYGQVTDDAVPQSSTPMMSTPF